MNNEEKYKYWLDIAEYDFETARAMYISGRYLYVAFMCQQAVEKIVKGLHVLYTGEEADRTHNIARIFNKIFKDPSRILLLKDADLTTKKDHYIEFFAELLFYYISERYPTYKQKLSTSISKQKAKTVLDKTEEVFEWLKSLAQYKKY